MNLNQPYSRDSYLQFLRDSFVSDSFKIRVEKLIPEFKTSYIKKVEHLGEDDNLDLHVFEVQHESEYDPRVSLSKETFRLMSQYGMRKALAVYISPKSENFRFSFITIDLSLDGSKIKRTYSNPRRYSYYLGPQAKTRTPDEFLKKKGRVSDLDDLKSRFSVEVVNKEFYKSIAQRFTELVGGQRKIGSNIEKFKRTLTMPSVDMSDAKTYQEFAVRLIGRLVFCWFLKMKKSDNGKPLIPDEVLSLDAAKRINGYYHNVVEKLFFEVLNTPFDDRYNEFKIAPYRSIPFLNGGLFNPHYKDFYVTDRRGVSKYLNTLNVPDTWLRRFIEILETYNFTVDENTSVDIDLSVDPEMLGRIFENLLAEINPETGKSARKATGSYYTPRPIVEYMVEESLKLYILTKTGIDEDKLPYLLTYDDIEPVFSDIEKQKIVSALDSVKILDPACGSGAFSIGILNKMLVILSKVDPDSQMWLDRQLKKIDVPSLRDELKQKLESENVAYIHKLGIIQNAVHGVDIQPVATELSKLRCFLSLIVDESVEDEEDNRGIRPLPNLEFKFVSANTLIGLANESQREIFHVDEEIAKLEELRKLYFSSSGLNKNNLEIDYKNLQKKLAKNYLFKNDKDNRALRIANWDPFSDEPSDWFDPKWMFGIEKGFDIVIGNPPYGVKFSATEKQELRKLYPQTQFKVDSYSIFILKSLYLLSDIGYCSFIITNAFLDNYYEEKVREKLLNYTDIKEIIDLDDKVFESGVVHAMIISYTKNRLNRNKVRVNYSLKHDNDLTFIPQNYFLKNDKYTFSIREYKNINLFTAIRDNTIPFHNVIDLRQAIKTGNDNMFILNRATKSNHKPILRGRDVLKWKIISPNLYVDYGDHLACPRDYRIFEQPKILIREAGSNITAAYDDNNYYIMSSLYNGILKNKNYDLLYVLCIINSNIFQYMMNKQTFEKTKGAFTKAKIYHYNNMPIKVADKNIQNVFSILAKYIIKLKKNNVNTTYLEKIINALVYEIYLPELVKKANASLFTHIIKMKDIVIDSSDDSKTIIADKLLKELNDSVHPINIAIQKVLEIEEVMVIEKGI